MRDVSINNSFSWNHRKVEDGRVTSEQCSFVHAQLRVGSVSGSIVSLPIAVLRCLSYQRPTTDTEQLSQRWQQLQSSHDGTRSDFSPLRWRCETEAAALTRYSPPPSWTGLFSFSVTNPQRLQFLQVFPVSSSPGSQVRSTHSLNECVCISQPEEVISEPWNGFMLKQFCRIWTEM